MRSSITYTALSLSSLLLASARPFVPDTLERRKPASYSVVAVGGGSTDDSSPTATVTDAVTHTQTVLQTQLSTIIVTASNTPTTIVFTVTTPSPITITDYAPAATAVATTTEVSTIPTTEVVYVSTQIPAPSQENSPTPVTTTETRPPQPPATVTVTQPLPSTTPYDDGQWHTYYYHTVESESTPAGSTTTSGWNVEWSGVADATSVIITGAPSPTFEAESWHGHGPPGWSGA
ncbi:hypothetical protein H2200_010706 [Cladophialophora chaetospira]|uniref:Uncharacterized protein n=1 Tax=Cladophialophora chaetospira TaxID=386627 RepID=A0AA38X0R2_9EURO|nr:hypothetical protein H2200_010706 [Cladophialophora chaetospira]